jgi:hypothetical protein
MIPDEMDAICLEALEEALTRMFAFV